MGCQKPPGTPFLVPSSAELAAPLPPGRRRDRSDCRGGADDNAPKVVAGLAGSPVGAPSVVLDGLKCALHGMVFSRMRRSELYGGPSAFPGKVDAYHTWRVNWR